RAALPAGGRRPHPGLRIPQAAFRTGAPKACSISRRARTALEAASTATSLHLRGRSEEHTSELQSRFDLVCRLLLEKKKNNLHGHDTQEHVDSYSNEHGM